MIFSAYRDALQIESSSFLNEPVVATGILGTVKVKNKLSPNTPSAIANRKSLALIKMHQEYLERTRIAFNYDDEETIVALNLISGELIDVKRNQLGYGFNVRYGYMDTTGTASGNQSKRLKQKALLELIEKNEAMLFWYGILGERIKPCDVMNNMIAQIGYHSDEICIYKSRNIGNINTFYVFLFDKSRIIATGVGAGISDKEGILAALYEAKLGEYLFRNINIDPYVDYSTEQFSLIYEHLNKYKMSHYNFENNENRVVEIILEKWIQSVNIAILNTGKRQNWTTIRCFSEDLINCIPIREQLKNVKDKMIFKKYGYLMIQCDDIPNCIII